MNRLLCCLVVFSAGCAPSADAEFARIRYFAEPYRNFYQTLEILNGTFDWQNPDFPPPHGWVYELAVTQTETVVESASSLLFGRPDTLGWVVERTFLAGAWTFRSYSGVFPRVDGATRLATQYKRDRVYPIGVVVDVEMGAGGLLTRWLYCTDPSAAVRQTLSQNSTGCITMADAWRDPNLFRCTKRTPQSSGKVEVTTVRCRDLIEPELTFGHSFLVAWKTDVQANHGFYSRVWVP